MTYKVAILWCCCGLVCCLVSRGFELASASLHVVQPKVNDGLCKADGKVWVNGTMRQEGIM